MLYTLKNNDEYAVFAKNKSEAVKKFKTDLNILTSKKMLKSEPI